MIAENEKEIVLRRAAHDGKAFDFGNFHTYAEVSYLFFEMNLIFYVLIQLFLL